MTVAGEDPLFRRPGISATSVAHQIPLALSVGSWLVEATTRGGRWAEGHVRFGDLHRSGLDGWLPWPGGDHRFT
jgi:hypothetical protein